MAAERTRAVGDGLAAAVARYGVPEQILTDNAKVFTDRFAHPPVEVLFDRICRENGIEYLLTAARSPTTTGKIERFHRSMRVEFPSSAAAFTNLKTAQQALDEWVGYYNSARPHQSLSIATPPRDSPQPQLRHHPRRPNCPAGIAPATTGSAAASAATVGFAWPDSKSASGATTPDSAVMSTSTASCCAFWIGDNLVKTADRAGTGTVRNKRALRTRGEA